MQFRIAETFTDSIAKLNGDEQTLAKNAAFDLQMNTAHPGLQFHRLDKAKDKNFWSIRAGRDIRLIVHKSDANFLLCYVGHHDKAYRWAERRRLERHPKTGAAQFVEIRETVREIQIPSYVVSTPKPEPPVLQNVNDEDLLAYGVPEEWLADVKSADEDGILALADHLPAEAAEAVLTLATGGTPETVSQYAADADPFEHPDAKRRFRLLANSDELQLALDFPWEKWAVYLHPDQRVLVHRASNGPTRVAGSAGTGKTVVAIHRAVYQARKSEESKVLLTTFSKPLANSLSSKLACLVGGDKVLESRITVAPIEATAIKLFTARHGEPKVAKDAKVHELLQVASDKVEQHKFNAKFLFAEWSNVVDAWQLTSWEAYRDVKRLGRKTRLSEAQRKIAWEIFELVKKQLVEESLITYHGIYSVIVDDLKNGHRSPFTDVVVDEAQDISVSQLKFVAALAGSGSKGNLLFAGDLGQRIFQTPFSWKSLGVDIRGRSHTLQVNYRTSHQIRSQADRLLPPELTDVDGNRESRRQTISAFTGPKPLLQIFEDREKEVDAVGKWLRDRVSELIQPSEIGIVVRTSDEFGRAKDAVESARITFRLDPFDESDSVSIVTMHQAKGLEFKCVVVMACDDDLVPLEVRIGSVSDQGDLEDVYNTERHLLYVACTRARDQLLVTGVAPASEFLGDLSI